MNFTRDLIQLFSRISDADTHKFCALMAKYETHLDEISQNLYVCLEEDDRERFLIWFVKRWASIDLTNPVEKALYEETIKKFASETCTPEKLNGKTYKRRDFSSQGYPFSLLGYDWFLGVHDVFYNQYEHKSFRVEEGDVIIDAGGFIGDTAILFNEKTKSNCKIHTFELLDENIQLMNYNLEINKVPHSNVIVNKLALTNSTGGRISIATPKIQGATSIFCNSDSENAPTIETTTLDDYVIANKLKKLDMIKMDIEGAEMPALYGAMETIKFFKPKLALCLYHKWDDVITIPRFLKETGVNYGFSFKWVQLKDGWEAVLLAQPILDGIPHAIDSSEGMKNDHAAFIKLSAAYLKKFNQATSLGNEKKRTKGTGGDFFSWKFWGQKLWGPYQ